MRTISIFFLDHEDAHTLFHSHLYVFMWSSNSFSRRKFQLEFATPAVTLENYTHYLHTGAIYIFNPVASSFTNVRIAYCTYIHSYEWVWWMKWIDVNKKNVYNFWFSNFRKCLPMIQWAHIQNVRVIAVLCKFHFSVAKFISFTYL